MIFVCDGCERQFQAYPAHRAGSGCFCNRACRKIHTAQRRAADLTHGRLLELLDYSPNTGIFAWRVKSTKRQIGDRAGWQHHKGYRWIELDGKAFQEHRLAWFYVTGRWPPNQIDHENLCKSDNRWSNLRLATNAQNQWNTKARKNSKTGVKGVWAINGRYRAQIREGGRVRVIGEFRALEEAAAAYVKAAEYRGEFGRVK